MPLRARSLPEQPSGARAAREILAARRRPIQTYARPSDLQRAARPAWRFEDQDATKGVERRPEASPWLGLAARDAAAHHDRRSLTPSAVLQLQRSIGNAGVARLLVQRCAPGEVPDEGCAECGQPPVQRQAVAVATVQRADDYETEPAAEPAQGGGEATELEEGASSTCTPATQAVAFTNSAFKVSFEGLDDLNTKVAGKLSGSAGHVNMAAMPTFSVTCWDGTGSSRTVGAAKVTAKGTATFPTPAEPDDSKWKTQSADRTREVQGIKDYFSIVQAHEASHVKIYTDAYNAAAADLVGLTESAAKTKFNSIVCESFKSQDSLDNAEGCMVVTNGKDAAKGKASECGLTPNAAASCP